MSALLVGYARCSTDQQDLTAQRDGLTMLGVAPERVYVDHGLTGTNRERPGLREALAACRAGDTPVVTKLDRLARSLPDARAIADELTARQVSLNLGGSVYDPTDAVGRLLFNVLAMAAEFESDLIRLRTKEGAMVSWNPARSHLSAGTWGVALVHADDNEHFTTNRGVVESFTRDQAETVAELMNQELAAAAAAGDPSCVSAETGASGRYSQLLEYFAHEGTPIEIVRAEPRELSRAAIIAGRRVENYYAPLLALIDVETNEPFELGDALLLLTDPLRLPDFVANWTAAGADVPTLATAIIRDDAQFDALVAGYALRSVRVVVNPLLKRDGSLASGVILAPELLWLRGYRNPFDEDET